jgi:hypothetical protein
MHSPTPMVFAPFPLQDCEIGGTGINATNIAKLPDCNDTRPKRREKPFRI